MTQRSRLYNPHRSQVTLLKRPVKSNSIASEPTAIVKNKK